MTSQENPKNALETVNSPEISAVDNGLRRLVETTIGPNLKGLPKQNMDLVIEEVTMMVSMSGPLPPPAIAREFEQLCPGYVDRSLALAEKAQAASIEAQRDERDKNQFYRVFGMACAVLILAILVGGGIAIAIKANVYVGSFTALSGVVASAVALFINGRPLADGDQTGQTASSRQNAESKPRTSPKSKVIPNARAKGRK